MKARRKDRLGIVFLISGSLTLKSTFFIVPLIGGEHIVVYMIIGFMIGEVLFWTGVILAGKQILKKYKDYLPRNRSKKKHK